MARLVGHTELGVAEPLAVHRTWAEVLDQDVGVKRETLEQIATYRVLQVDADSSDPSFE